MTSATSEHHEGSAGVRRVDVPAENVVVVNQTNWRLQVMGLDGDALVLPPLGRRTVASREAVGYPLADAVHHNFLRLEQEPASVQVRLTAVVLGAGVVVAAGYAVYAALHGFFLPILAPLALLAVIALWYFWSESRRRAFVRWGMPMRFAELGVLLLALGAAVVAPALSIFYATDVQEGWFYYKNGMPEERDIALVFLLGSSLQWLLVMTFAGVPALLYFAFDREQLQTLRAKFVVHVFRFDPAVVTVADIDAKYGRLMDEAYGRETLTGRILPGKRLPVVIATGAIAVGWLLTLPLPTFNQALNDEPSVHDYLRPHEEPIVFAFLGAYFFALNLAYRGYVRGDLRPKTYSQITVRILLSFVLAFVLGQAFSSNALILLIAFIGGVLPETLLVRFREALRRRIGRVRSEGALDPLDALVEQQPLTELEGVDIYDRARLEEEGVTNVESLAHHDLVELMLRTRIPVPRLIDWVDQAVLYLHLGGRTDEARRARLTLRQHGIRTASDLIKAWRKDEDSGRHLLVDLLVPTPAGMPSRLSMIVDAIDDEEWIATLLNWHDRRNLETETVPLTPLFFTPS